MLPLEGLRVLDLSRVLSGPFCTMNLGDMGAEVLKVERPGQGDDTRSFGPPFAQGVSTYFLAVNRNKKSVAVNLKVPAGVELVKRLAQTCDVVVENFRPGVADRLGVGYEALRHERLVYCSISGFGRRGLEAYGRLPGYDVVLQGLSGVQHLTGQPDGPPTKVGVSIADLVTGLVAFQSILLALLAREKSGRGQHLDVSMLDATASLLTFQGSAHLVAGAFPQRLGNQHPSIVPYELFRARDGYFNLAVATDEQFARLCGVLGQPALAQDPRFAQNRDRVEHRVELNALLGERFAGASVDAWVERLLAQGIPAGAVLDVPSALAHPQLVARGLIHEVDHPQVGPMKVLGGPLPFPGQEVVAPPRLGEHTREVLARLLGASEDELDSWARHGVIDAG